MNLIEALKLADGKPVTHKSWNCDSCFTFAENGQIIWERSCTPVCLRKDDFFSDDWYVVEPKSKIEEAIEREVVEFYNRPMNEVESTGGKIPQILRRIVNVTLDEAKEALFSEGFTSGRQVEKVIDALKVKE